MSWNRDEAASLLELMGTLTDRMRDLAEIFTPMTGKEPGTDVDPERSRGRSLYGDIDIDSIKRFTEAVTNATPPVITFGKSIDSLGDKLSAMIREQTNIGSAGGFRAPMDYDTAKPAGGQRQYPADTLPANVYNPDKPYTKPNLPGGMYTPIRNYMDAEKWFLSKVSEEKGQAQAYIDLRDKLTPDITKYIPLIQAGFDPTEVGKLATKDAKDALVKMAQQATAVPANIKPRRAPKVPYMTRGQRLRARVAKGIFWGGVTGGVRGAVRGGIVGAGINLFKNPAVIASSIALAMPKIMEATANYSDRQIDESRRYAAFAPDTLRALVNYDMNNFYRSIDIARSTSPSAVNLIRQQDSLREAMQPYRELSTNFDNTFSSLLSGIGTGFFRTLNPIFRGANNLITSSDVQDNVGDVGDKIGAGVATASLGWTAVSLLSWFIPGVAPYRLAVTGISAAAGFFFGGKDNPDNGKKEDRPMFWNDANWNGEVAPRPRAF